MTESSVSQRQSLRSTFWLPVLGFGLAGVLFSAAGLVLAGLRIDEQGTDPFTPELAYLWSVLALGLIGVLSATTAMYRSGH